MRAGYNVRGIVRSELTADKVHRAFPEYEEELSLVVVPDILRTKAFGEAVQGVTEAAAIEGTINILDSITRNAPQVRQVVHTSSFGATLDPSKGTWPGHVYTEADWNPMTYAEVVHEDTTVLAAYYAGKAGAERAAQDFMATETPPFDLVTTCPPYVCGPIKRLTASLAHLNTPSMEIYRLMSPI
ncbi:hypothetical protein BDV28DRAFT_162735 [Aspergillus coremiiformis]|uniref:NAD-dependent epimerase/dehydratase domain-containing protein n=1 Tax=Aspergillus coremiiformis TaxID=138285 RepID=A0A5N6ZEP5_9EURO|nr:hypothetical protein BDV28DRAFT_162735 [Aspergillus coremiiformis]